MVVKNFKSFKIINNRNYLNEEKDGGWDMGKFMKKAIFMGLICLFSLNLVAKKQNVRKMVQRVQDVPTVKFEALLPEIRAIVQSYIPEGKSLEITIHCEGSYAYTYTDDQGIHYLCLSELLLSHYQQDKSHPFVIVSLFHEMCHIRFNHSKQRAALEKYRFASQEFVKNETKKIFTQDQGNFLSFSATIISLSTFSLYNALEYAYEMYFKRQQEFQADQFAFEHADTEILINFIETFKRYRNDIKHYVQSIIHSPIHPTMHDQCNMALAELRKRSVKI